MPNDDLISRSALLEKECCGRISGNDVRNAPAVDAEPVRHATWEKGLCAGFVGCSECHDVFINSDWLHDGKWKYCPNCGAKMGKEE